MFPFFHIVGKLIDSERVNRLASEDAMLFAVLSHESINTIWAIGFSCVKAIDEMYNFFRYYYYL